MLPLLLQLPLGGSPALNLEQRMDEMEERFAQMQARIVQLEGRDEVSTTRIATLEAENYRLRPAETMQRYSVDPSSAIEGRQLSATANECCRWTASGTCAGMTSAREQACTMLHEYLEMKTTTHAFQDLQSCIGAGESGWKPVFNGVHGNVTLKNGATEKATFPTPLKVTHAANCATTQPTADLQLHTNLAAGLSVQGLDITAAALALAYSSASTCIKITTGTFTYADGFLTVLIRDTLNPDWPGRVVTSGFFEKGAVVVKACFNGFKAIILHNCDTDAWGGTMHSSNDGGTTYDQPMVCIVGDGGFCRGESATSNMFTIPGAQSDGIIVDKDRWASSSVPSAFTKGPVCDQGKFCSFVRSAAQTCVAIDVQNEGYLQMRVIDSRSTSATDWQGMERYHLSGDAPQYNIKYFHSAGTTIPASGDNSFYTWCFDGFQKMAVTNAETNAIRVDMTVSTDAGVTFNKFMTCTGCHSSGATGAVAKLTVDGDAGTTDHQLDGMVCEDGGNGNWCELTVT